MKNFTKVFLTGLALLASSSLASAQAIDVAAADGINAAIDFANAGNADTLRLVDGASTAVYELAPVAITSPMVIMAAPGLSEKPLIRAAAGIEQNDYITVDNDLTVIGVIIDGQTVAGDYAKYKFMFKVNNPPGDAAAEAPSLWVKDSHLRNVYQNGDPATAADGTFFDISRTSYAENLHFENTTFENSGDEGIRSINTHKEPIHPNVWAFGSLVVRNCTFININGSSIKIEGDSDSTNVDPEVVFENLTFWNCQRRVIWERDNAGSIMRNLIIANSKTGNDTFGGTDVLISFQRAGSVVSHIDTFRVEHIVGDDTVRYQNRRFFTKGGDRTNSSDPGTYEATTVYGYDPMFADPENGDFTLMAGSPVYTLAHDGGALGDRRWATNPPAPGTKIDVRAVDGLVAAIDFAMAGNADTLVLVDDPATGVYELTDVDIIRPLVIMAAPGLSSMNIKPLIRASDSITPQNDWITADEDLTVIGVTIDGQTPTGAYAQLKYMFKINNPAADSPINDSPRLRVMDSHLRNMYQEGDPAISTNGTFFDISTGAHAGSVHFERTTFENSGDEAVRSINAHKSPVAFANRAIDALIIRDCTFNNINGSSVKLESDADSLTVDGDVLLENLTFWRAQRRVIWVRETENTIMRNLIIANSKLGNDTFSNTDVLISFQRRNSVVAYVDTFNIQKVNAQDSVFIRAEAFLNEGGSRTGSSDKGIVSTSTIYNFDPMFVDPENGNFTLASGSMAYNKGHDGGPIGDRRWATMGVSVRETAQGILPSEFELSQNYPNPFNPTTTIRYAVKRAAHVKIQVFDMLGRVVETLVDDKRPAGTYALEWIPDRSSSGVYFYRMLIDGQAVETKKMTLLK